MTPPPSRRPGEEGDISEDLTRWMLPYLIFAGAGDDDFLDQARRTAEEIPDARFIWIEAPDHLGAHLEHDRVNPAILQMLRGAQGQ